MKNTLTILLTCLLLGACTTANDEQHILKVSGNTNTSTQTTLFATWDYKGDFIDFNQNNMMDAAEYRADSNIIFKFVNNGTGHYTAPYHDHDLVWSYINNDSSRLKIKFLNVGIDTFENNIHYMSADTLIFLNANNTSQVVFSVYQKRP